MFGILYALVLLQLVSAVRKRLPSELSENERVNLWHSKGYTWPPTFQPETDGMRALMEERELEIMAIPGGNERWENWLQYTQSRFVPKFTKLGFEVVSTPPDVHARLVAAVSKAVEDFESIPSEGVIDVIYTPPHKDPKFVNLGKFRAEVGELLRPMHEAWAGGIKLRPTSSYGVRLYQNESTLVMHYDKVETHVISSIVHIAHEYDDDNEPWPVQIEDHHGRLHSVSLEAGQMLFYESSKCLHGRMTKLKGKYYGSIFVHYQPVDKTIWNYSHEDIIAAVPPHWRDGIEEDKGSRWAGAAITVNSRVTESAPHRTLNGEVLHETPEKLVFTPARPLDEL